MGEVISLRTKHPILSESEMRALVTSSGMGDTGLVSDSQKIPPYQTDSAENFTSVQPVEILLTAAIQLVHDAQILGIVEESALQKRLISKELDELSQRMLSGLRRIRAIAAN